MRISDWSSDVCSSDLPIVAKFSLRPEDVMSETARNLDQIVARQNEELADAMTFGVDAYTSEAYLRAERDTLWRKVWLQVGRVEDLPEVGSYLTYDILEDPRSQERRDGKVLCRTVSLRRWPNN